MAHPSPVIDPKRPALLSQTSTMPVSQPNLPSVIPVSRPFATQFASHSIINHSPLRFLIVDCPTASTLSHYLREFARYNVHDVVRVCEPTYSREIVEKAGIRVHDVPFPDGGVPSTSMVKQWMGVVANHAKEVRDLQDTKLTSSQLTTSSAGGASENKSKERDHTAAIQSPPNSRKNAPSGNNMALGTYNETQALPCVAVHCVAGLGRAPLLVCLALIEYGMEPLDAVELVRKHRRGALNSRQVAWVAQYKKLGVATTLANGDALGNNASNADSGLKKVGRWLGGLTLKRSSSSANALTDGSALESGLATTHSPLKSSSTMPLGENSPVISQVRPSARH